MTLDSGKLPDSPGGTPTPPAAQHVSRLGARWRVLRPWVPWVAGGLLLAFALNVIWWSLLSPSARKSDVEEFDIPAGTQAAIDRGDAVFLPKQFSVRAGGRLRILNQDSVEHTVGNVTVPPGATAELSAPASSQGEQLTCTIHPGGYLDLQLTERPGLQTTLFPTFLLGGPVGALAGLVAWVTRKIG